MCSGRIDFVLGSLIDDKQSKTYPLSTALGHRGQR